MSKAVLFVTLPLVAGLAVWNLVLSSEVEDLRARVGEAGVAKPAGKSDSGASASPSPREGASRSDPRFAELEQRLAEMERRVTSPSAAAAGTVPSLSDVDDGEPVAVAVPPEWDTESFRAAVGRVLDTREVERRQDRSARLAENLARNWFREMTLTATQRSEALRVIADSLRKLEEIRQDPSLTEDERRENLQRVQEDRLASLAGILDAAQMETVKTRAGARMRRGVGEGGAGGRGGERGGGGGETR